MTTKIVLKTTPHFFILIFLKLFMAKSRISKKKFKQDLEEAGSTRDYEKKENMKPIGIYQTEERIEAERDYLTQTGAGSVRQLKIKSEIEGKEVFEIPKDRAEFSTALDKEEEEAEKENGIDEKDIEEEAEDID